jgi:hypothetical protein
VKIEADEAWKLISSGKKIKLVKGTKLLEYDTADADRFEVLQIALGRSGSLRAPTINIGDEWVVGFSKDIYESLQGA